MKRKILIIEDNELNRELLAAMLEEDYDLLYAGNGEMGLRMLAEHVHELSLVMLDVYMPLCSGFEFLERIRDDLLLSSVPVIVTTGSGRQEDEVRSLRLGASDFVMKPYNIEVVRARVHSIIKLKESVNTLSVVEYDELTGVYTIQAFYHHAAEKLRSAACDFDLSIVDMKGFKLVNSIRGEKQGDEILLQMSRSLQRAMPQAIIGRQGDKFYFMYPSELRFDRTMAMNRLQELGKLLLENNIRAKWAVYETIDRELPIRTLCDRALMALATIKQDPNRFVVVYDNTIRQKLIEDREMEMRFEDAIRGEEFVVWFQPKIDTAAEKMIGAEALVRWLPVGGKMISPASFIPLFERDGLISRLDEYVFRKVCRFQKQRQEAGKHLIPISVNLSRCSIYRGGTVEKYAEIIAAEKIPMELVPIELTESATMESREFRSLAEELKGRGFSLHMDDFGTGYSSLADLSSMPLDVIKMDKSMIDHIGTQKGNSVIRHVVSLAQDMNIQTIAEGVETREQVDYLKSVSCNQIQGFYFSPPKAQEEFEGILDSEQDPFCTISRKCV